MRYYLIDGNLFYCGNGKTSFYFLDATWFPSEETAVRVATQQNNEGAAFTVLAIQFV